MRERDMTNDDCADVVKEKRRQECMVQTPFQYTNLMRAHFHCGGMIRSCGTVQAGMDV